MNQINRIEADRSAQLAGALFDEVLVPLAQARRNCGAPAYFPAWRESDAASYFVTPDIAIMTLADFEMQGGGGAEELIDMIAAYWSAQGETALAAMAPRLKEFAVALTGEAAANEGIVDILCYTLF